MSSHDKQGRRPLCCAALALTLAACSDGPSTDSVQQKELVEAPQSVGEPPVINSFGASDRLLSPGDTSTLTWDVGKATSVQLSAATVQSVGNVTGKSSIDVTGKSGNGVALKSGNDVAGSMAVTHTESTMHTLTATNAFGSDTATVMVNVIAVSPDLPSDIPVGAPSATLEDAAAFAWQEFIALNWPALTGNRDMPDKDNGKFGAAGPVVWETFRHKLETFPGTGIPHGGSNYNDPPQYIYKPESVGNYANVPSGGIPACSSQAGGSTPFINLDEQDEIGLDQMFAGHVVPGSQYDGQQILFLAKSNQIEYDYVFPKGWYVKDAAPVAQTTAYVQKNKASPPPGSTDLVSFNNGTVEIKAAWRKLTTDENASGKFYTAPVRYYQKQDETQTYGGVTGDPTHPCYVDEQTGWGLVGLHIIQKTPTAPYFIFATFEQGDNILYPNGKPVEDVNGNLLDPDGNRVADLTSLDPLSPNITSQNATAADPPTASSIQRLSPAEANASPPVNQLYYRNTPGNTEPQGNVYINRRTHAIPAAVIEANTEAHEAIAADNKANGLADSPWNYYKLINVQYKPIDKPTPGQDYTGDDVATYYQANIVVETDYDLQTFSGTFQPYKYPDGTPIASLDAGSGVLITDFDITGNPAKNVYYNGNAFNMGGCMGCHGNAQVGGGDFSFILTSPGYFNLAPEIPGPEQPPNLGKFLRLLPQQP